MIKPYVTLYTNRKKSEDGYPVCLCMTVNRKQIKKTLFHCQEKDWNILTQRVRKSHPDNQGLNILISNELAETQKKIIDAINQDKPIDKSIILPKVEDVVPTDFFILFQKFIEEKTNIGTVMRLESVLNKLKRYIKRNDLPISSIDIEWISNYERYLKVTLRNATNTINKNMKTLSSIFNFAIKRNYCTSNPFSNYKFRTERTLKIPLTRDEFNQIRNIELTGKEELYRDSFVLAVYLRGIRVSDLIQLKKDCIYGDRLIYKTSKDKEYHNIKISSDLRAIIDRYAPKSDNYILPLIKDIKKYENNPSERQKRKTIECTTAKINKSIKKVALKCGIKKRISTHIARHTFASFVTRSGAPLTITQQLLGHSDPSITSTYVAELESASELDLATEQALNF